MTDRETSRAAQRRAGRSTRRTGGGLVLGGLLAVPLWAGLPAALAQQTPPAPTVTAQLEQDPEIPVDPAVLELLAAAEGVRVPDELMRLLQTQDPRAEAAIAEFLADGNPTPRQLSARAVALAQRVKADPILKRGNRVTAITDRITRTVSSTLGGPRLVSVALDNDYVPPEGALAFDFGGWNTPAAAGFERLTPASPQIFGANLTLQENVGDGAVLSDAVGGMTNLRLDVPNGTYRVILLTTPTVANAVRQPFGTTFGVNGVSYTLGTATSDTWWPTAHLRGRGGPAPGVPVGGQGGAIVVEAEVVNGILQLDFAGGYSGLNAVLSGLVVEPTSIPSSLTMEGPAAQETLPLEQALELELVTQVAILESFAPAAGPGTPAAAAPAPPPAAAPQQAARRRALGRAVVQSAGLTQTPEPFDPELGVSPVSPVSQ